MYAITPPAFHIVAYVTGGCKELYNFVKNPGLQNLSEASYTCGNGSFEPCENMPLLGRRYKYIGIIGSGESAILIRAKDMFQKEKEVAIKVLNIQYEQLGSQEAESITKLNQADPCCISGTVQLYNTFRFLGHYCMVFELLDPLPIMKYNIHAFSFPKCYNAIREIAMNMLKSLGFLQQQNIIHGDLKPENILLKKRGDFSSVTILDFGNAISCVYEELALYYDNFDFQTLLWRAPEVIYGMNFGLEVDMWSYGCILAELYLGKPIFFGQTKEQVLSKMVDLLGPLPGGLFQRGKYFPDLKNYTSVCTQQDVTLNLMKKLGITDFHFANFLSKCFKYDPSLRLTVFDAATMPFLANHFSLAFLLPQPGKGKQRCYTSDIITSEAYPFQPSISNPDVMHMTSHELLSHGTSDSKVENMCPSINYTFSPRHKGIIKVAQVSPVQRKTTPLERKPHQSRSLTTNKLDCNRYQSEHIYTRSSAFTPVSIRTDTNINYVSDNSAKQSSLTSNQVVLIKPRATYCKPAPSNSESSHSNINAYKSPKPAIITLDHKNELNLPNANPVLDLPSSNCEDNLAYNCKQSGNPKEDIINCSFSDTDNEAFEDEDERQYDAYINSLLEQTNLHLERAGSVASSSLNNLNSLSNCSTTNTCLGEGKSSMQCGLETNISKSECEHVEPQSNTEEINLETTSSGNMQIISDVTSPNKVTESRINSSPWSIISSPSDSVVMLLAGESSRSNSPDLSVVNQTNKVEKEDIGKLEEKSKEITRSFSKSPTKKLCFGLNDTFTVSPSRHDNEQSIDDSLPKVKTIPTNMSKFETVSSVDSIGNKQTVVLCKRKLSPEYVYSSKEKATKPKLDFSVKFPYKEENGNQENSSTGYKYSVKPLITLSKMDKHISFSNEVTTFDSKINSPFKRFNNLGKPQRVANHNSNTPLKTANQVTMIGAPQGQGVVNNTPLGKLQRLVNGNNNSPLKTADHVTMTTTQQGQGVVNTTPLRKPQRLINGYSNTPLKTAKQVTMIGAAQGQGVVNNTHLGKLPRVVKNKSNTPLKNADQFRMVGTPQRVIDNTPNKNKSMSPSFSRLLNVNIGKPQRICKTPLIKSDAIGDKESDGVYIQTSDLVNKAPPKTHIGEITNNKEHVNNNTDEEEIDKQIKNGYEYDDGDLTIDDNIQDVLLL